MVVVGRGVANGGGVVLSGACSGMEGHWAGCWRGVVVVVVLLDTRLGRVRVLSDAGQGVASCGCGCGSWCREWWWWCCSTRVWDAFGYRVTLGRVLAGCRGGCGSWCCLTRVWDVFGYRRNIKEEWILGLLRGIARKDGSLNSGSIGNCLIRIDALIRLLAIEEV